MSDSASANPAFLDLLGSLKAPLDVQLEAVLERSIAKYGALGDEIAWMLESALTLCRGGKRLRAGLVAAGFEMASGTPAVSNDRVLGVGVAVELLQSYFLVHDDWMDRDATRRGNPTVHADLGRRFADEHLGACGAVLAGDFLVTLAHREFQRVALTCAAAPHLLEEFTRMQLAAIAGQQLDVIGLSRNALAVYELKTGSYTVSGPLILGMLLGGAPVSVTEVVDRFALPVGVAFQLRDDLLNLFSPPAQTGKPQGSDITAGKWTWTTQWLQRHGSSAQRSAFELAFGNRSASERLLEDALLAVESSGARSATERYIAELEAASAQERAALASLLDLTPRAISLLDSAVSALVHRRA
jgi:geranylgeranyl diphosphate synthase, type I